MTSYPCLAIHSDPDLHVMLLAGTPCVTIEERKKMKTMREKFITALEARGERQVASKSRKFVILTRAAGGHYYVGKSGSLRVGATVAGSIPSSDAFKAKLLEGAT